jgi:signal transduction histidine kinase
MPADVRTRLAAPLEDAAGRAVADERTRIAGELHDVVAHALSAMTVQAAVARRLALTRPELAREAFGAIETAGREALDELRRLLGVLRREDAALTLAPQPSVRHVRSLARRVTAAGLSVTLRVEGTELELPAGVDATAYRVVQDTLAAALEHRGAGRADVRVRLGADAVEVEIRDDGRSPDPRSLTGVRERVALHGGSLTALSRPEGGHRVRATLPLDGHGLPREEREDPPCPVLERGRGRPRWLRRPAVAYAGLVLLAAAPAAIIAAMDDPAPATYLLPLPVGGVAWYVVRARARRAAEVVETSARRAEASRRAATDDRRRIARELHDLVAHSISVMVVQAGGARRILDRDPGRALEAATRIERTGREALGEMRHLLGVLNDSDHPAVLAPQPTLAEIGELVGRARAAGLPTVLELRGTRRPLPAGLDLAAYRIVQEALTNALKHAGHAPTTVTVDWSERALAVEVRDRGRAAPPAADAGHGLVGMRERVRLYGGELEAGPAEGGGWRVRAELPLAVRQLSLAS